MKTFVCALGLAILVTSSVAAEEPARCPWTFATGNWKVTDDSGYSADVTWELAGDDNAAVGTWKDKDGAEYTELAGWRPDKKMLVSTAYGTNGAYWDLQCTTVTGSQIKGNIVDRRPDGTTYTGTWQCTKKNDDYFEILFVGSDGTNEKIEIKGSFQRRK